MQDRAVARIMVASTKTKQLSKAKIEYTVWKVSWNVPVHPHRRVSTSSVRNIAVKFWQSRRHRLFVWRSAWFIRATAKIPRQKLAKYLDYLVDCSPKNLQKSADLDVFNKILIGSLLSFVLYFVVFGSILTKFVCCLWQCALCYYDCRNMFFPSLPLIWPEVFPLPKSWHMLSSTPWADGYWL